MPQQRNWEHVQTYGLFSQYAFSLGIHGKIACSVREISPAPALLLLSYFAGVELNDMYMFVLHYLVASKASTYTKGHVALSVIDLSEANGSG